MGCGDACPFYPGKRYEDWELDDPAGQGVDAVRPIRDEIDRRCKPSRELLTPTLKKRWRAHSATYDQTDEDGHLDQRADDPGERFARGDAEDADRHGDGELEVVARRSERDRRRCARTRIRVVARRRTRRTT